MVVTGAAVVGESVNVVVSVGSIVEVSTVGSIDVVSIGVVPNVDSTVDDSKVDSIVDVSKVGSIDVVSKGVVS